MKRSLLPFVFLLSVAANATLPQDFTAYLKNKGMLGSSEETCKEMENKIGQLFYVRVDNFQTDQFIHPYYNKLISQIKPGGILLRRNRSSSSLDRYSRNWDEVDKIKKNAGPILPFIADDYSALGGGFPWLSGSDDFLKNNNSCNTRIIAALIYLSNYTTTWNPAIEPVYIENLLKYYNADNASNHSSFENFSKIYDYNTAEKNLGPYIKNILAATAEFEVIPSLKHFPIRPNFVNGKIVNLHNESPDIPLTKDDLDRITRRFQESSNDGFIMTTHSKSSLIDSEEIVTTSKAWIDYLKNVIGAKNQIIMTDALDMIDSFPSATLKAIAQLSKEETSDYKNLKINQTSQVAYKAIMAGHDMISYQDDAQKTETYYKDFLKMACQNSPSSETFQNRVREAYDKILAFKQRHNKEMNRQKINLTESQINNLINAVHSHNRCESPEIKEILSSITNHVPFSPVCKTDCDTTPLSTELTSQVDKLKILASSLKNNCSLDQLSKWKSMPTIPEKALEEISDCLAETADPVFSSQGFDFFLTPQNLSPHIQDNLLKTLSSNDSNARLMSARVFFENPPKDKERQLALSKHLGDENKNVSYWIQETLKKLPPLD